MTLQEAQTWLEDMHESAHFIVFYLNSKKQTKKLSSLHNLISNFPHWGHLKPNKKFTN